MGLHVNVPMNGNEPAVDQGIFNGWQLSWNPDNGRYYVNHPDGATIGTWKDLRNARQYARTHDVNKDVKY